MWISSGSFSRDARSRNPAAMPSTEERLPRAGITQDTTRSPQASSGMPKVTASSTPGMPRKTVVTSSG